MDLNNQTEVEWIKTNVSTSEDPTAFSSAIVMNGAFVINNKLYFYQENLHPINTVQYIRVVDLILNRQNALLMPIRNFIATDSISGYGTRITPIKINSYLFMIISYPTAQRQLLFFMPNMLITINNLPQEIIKSPEQTMKVTYTIVDDNYVTD